MKVNLYIMPKLLLRNISKESLDLKSKSKYFLKVFLKAEKHYANSDKRLAGDGWKNDWQTLITVMLSAQTRDETTIPVAESLFKKYPTLNDLSKANESDILKIISKVNFKYTKAKNISKTIKELIYHHNGKVPNTIEKLVTLPGVGRKTANLVLSEVHKKDGICVDTHVHRISNVLGFVNTKNPTETEFELMKIAPKKYWSKINRVFVLWGKEVPGRNKEKLLNKINFK